MIQYSSINDAWGNKDINKKSLNNIEKFINRPPLNNNIPAQVASAIEHPIILDTKNNLNKEQFVSEVSQCSFTEHLKTCDNCKKIIAEYFINQNSNVREIKLWGLQLSLPTETLKVIFIILIILIFILLLSMVNISFKNNNIGMKYYMVPSNFPNFSGMPGQYFSN